MARLYSDSIVDVIWNFALKEKLQRQENNKNCLIAAAVIVLSNQNGKATYKEMNWNI